MAQWTAGKVLKMKPGGDGKIQRIAARIDVAWIIARHGVTIFFMIRMKDKKEVIAYCAEQHMPQYFTLLHIHEQMPFVSGDFKDARLFPDQF